jgi:hypothetical protein
MGSYLIFREILVFKGHLSPRSAIHAEMYLGTLCWDLLNLAL